MAFVALCAEGAGMVWSNAVHVAAGQDCSTHSRRAARDFSGLGGGPTVGRLSNSRHIGVPLFLALCVVAITLAAGPFLTTAQTPPATVEATTQTDATDTQTATDTTTNSTDQTTTTDQGGATTGDSSDGTPSDTSTGMNGDTPTSTVEPTESPTE